MRTVPPSEPMGSRPPAPSLIVLWETTKACPLRCRHCRATALPSAQPGELSSTEAHRMLASLGQDPERHPVLVMSGGDCMLRPDLVDLAAHARSVGARVAISPAISPALTERRLVALRALGVRQVSVSLDGAEPATHDAVRGVPGHYAETTRAIERMTELGFHVQVNTTVMRGNAEELVRVARRLREWGVRTWEVFFLITVGRGARLLELDPDELEDVCNVLVDVSRRGILVRTVEGPFYRRVLLERGAGPARDAGPLYERLHGELDACLGAERRAASPTPPRTGDGAGVVFVAHDGDVYPSGFLPYRLGNVRERPLLDLYDRSPELRAIRARRLSGACGACEHRVRCGGSRARAYATGGGLLGEDPACVRSERWQRARARVLAAREGRRRVPAPAARRPSR